MGGGTINPGCKVGVAIASLFLRPDMNTEVWDEAFSSLTAAHQVHILSDLLRVPVLPRLPSFFFSLFLLLFGSCSWKNPFISLPPYIFISTPHDIQVTTSQRFGLFGWMQQKQVLFNLNKEKRS